MLVKSLCIAYKIETLDFEIFRDREITPDPAAFLAADGLRTCKPVSKPLAKRRRRIEVSNSYMSTCLRYC